MKLNLDCMKDVMFVLEELLTVDCNGRFHCASVSEVKRHDLIRGNYDPGEVLYSLLQLHESEYILTDLSVDTERQEIKLGTILYIKPKGYDFLSASKEDRIWKSTKDFIKSAGSFSMKALEVAISAAIEGYIKASAQ